VGQKFNHKRVWDPLRACFLLFLLPQASLPGDQTEITMNGSLLHGYKVYPRKSETNVKVRPFDSMLTCLVVTVGWRCYFAIKSNGEVD